MTNGPTQRREIWRGLLFGQRAILLQLAAELKQDFGLTVPQYEALAALSELDGEPMPASTLAQRLLYSSGSASHLFSALEKRGLIRRNACPDDARMVMIGLTDEGSSLIRRASITHSRSIDTQFSPLIADDEVDVLLMFARRLSDARSSLGGSAQ